MRTDRFLAIDYGTVRLGIALSDPTNTLATGHATIENSPGAFLQIRAYVEEFGITAIVIGMPLNLKGEKGAKALEVERFREQLAAEVPAVSLFMHDERFSSQEAGRTLLAMGVKKKKRQEKGQIDRMAAALILQGFLDRRKHGK